MKHIVRVGLILAALTALPGPTSRSAIADGPLVPLGNPGTSPYGEVSGQVEIVRGIPLTNEFGQFTVLVEGVPNRTLCAADGTFILLRVPSGSRILVAYAPPEFSWALGGVRLSHRKPVAVVAGGQASDAGTLVIAMPGSVSGRITMTGEPVSDIASMVVAMPQFGLVTKPNTDGGYLLQGVPPGSHQLQLQFPSRAADAHQDPVSRRATTAAVVAGRPTLGVDFVLEGRRPTSPVDPTAGTLPPLPGPTLGTPGASEAEAAKAAAAKAAGGAEKPEKREGPGAKDPGGLGKSGTKDLVAVPDVRKMTLKEADITLREAGFGTSIGPRAPGSVPPWFVTGQRPAAGTMAPSGSIVELDVMEAQK